MYRDRQTTIFVNSHWAPRNPGAVLVIPNAHYENVYSLPDDLALPIHRSVRAAARAMKTALNADGVTIRQHNELAGDQRVWHYHVHVVPRYVDDAYLYMVPPFELSSETDRVRYAQRLRRAVQDGLTR